MERAEDSALQQTRVHFLGARGIEAVVAIDHTQGNQATLRWLLYDGHGNLVRTMAPDHRLSGWQFRGVWGEVQGNLALGRGYCANLGHVEDETGLVYMRARYYEPATGRFISEDPARDGVNWYLYADGNPVNRVDVEGRDAIADITQFIGNILVAIGILMLGGISFQAEWAAEYIGDKIVDKIVEISESPNVKQLVPYLKLLRDLKGIAENLAKGELDPISEVAKRWAGYNMIILGQLLLTEAEWMSPGEGEWWGYEF